MPLLLLVAIAACSQPNPTPTPIATPTPSLEPSPQPSVAEPIIDCDTTTEETPLTCDAAIAAALEVLPELSVPVARIQFFYGGPCPPNARCLAISPHNGYVVFVLRRSGMQPNLSVAVRANAAGGVRVTSKVQPYPPLAVIQAG